MTTSSAAPVIGVLLRPWAREGKPRRVMQDRSYLDAVLAAGGVPLPLPVLPTAALRALYDLCDGLLLPGGKDVDPTSYEAASAPDALVDSHPELDRGERTVLRWAWQDRRPVLGICRGMHAIAVARGGTLWHDLPRDRGGVSRHDGRDVRHDVRVVAGSLLAAVTGCLLTPVNSRHHQGLRSVGADLHAVASSPDGLVEAIEGPAGSFHLGVQWHPEDLPPEAPGGLPLVRALVAAAAGGVHRCGPHGAASPRSTRT